MEDIRTTIFNCGKELFASRGFKDTNVSDITNAVGIGIGKFYKHYSSKEQLFIEIFLEENEKLKKSIMQSVDPDSDPVNTVKQIVALNLEGMRSNPILKEWYNRDFFSKLEQEFYEQGGIEKSLEEVLNTSTVQLFEKWKSEGKIQKDIDNGFIRALFQAIFYIDIHKEEIGVEYFPKIMEYVTEAVMKSLTDRQE
ncbi:TetR/AcrR family transcriptional regulator [Oscillospiraceae bacterium PP1C4]